jgi:acyl-coenzyme A synthetase/AMP-(fatty) acid ligase
VDATELHGHCIARLNADKRPREFIVVAALPRNANGKVVRSSLRAQYDAGTAASASHG